MIWGRRQRGKTQGKQSFWACVNCRNVVISLWELRKRARGLGMKVISVFWVNSKLPWLLYDQSHPVLLSCPRRAHRTDCHLQVCRKLFCGFGSCHTDPQTAALGGRSHLLGSGYHGFRGVCVTHRRLCLSCGLLSSLRSCVKNLLHWIPSVWNDRLLSALEVQPLKIKS